LSEKHLVLENDVHRKLCHKKEDTGLTLRDLGNTLLRTLLSQEPFHEAVFSKLVRNGYMSREQLDAVLGESLKELRTKAPSAADLTPRPSDGAIAVGSWSIREVYRAPDDSCQILVSRARDARKRPFPPHTHLGEEMFVVVEGSLVVSVDHRSAVISAPGYVHVPRNAVHSTTPATADTLVIGIVCPAESAYET